MQHHFNALFYGVECTEPMVVPVPLCSNDVPCLWDYDVWVSARKHSRVLARDFLYKRPGQKRYQHCVLIYSDQRDVPVSYQNVLLSTDKRQWLGNVLVVWANNDWPPGLIPDIEQIRDAAFLDRQDPSNSLRPVEYKQVQDL